LQRFLRRPDFVSPLNAARVKSIEDTVSLASVESKVLIKNWLKRLTAASHIDCYMFAMRDGTVTYLPVGNALRGFGEAKDGPVSNEAETILNAQWSTCPKLYALMEAVPTR
jgi:hypothetical protein